MSSQVLAESVVLTVAVAADVESGRRREESVISCVVGEEEGRGTHDHERVGVEPADGEREHVVPVAPRVPCLQSQPSFAKLLLDV